MEFSLLLDNSGTKNQTSAKVSKQVEEQAQKIKELIEALEKLKAEHKESDEKVLLSII